MKEFFNLRPRNYNDIDEVVRFLNSSARKFYDAKFNFAFANYCSYLKATILSGLIDFERTIKGTFGCDIFMKTADIEKLKAMYPNATNNIYSVNDEESLKQMGRSLEMLRNMNAHAYLADRDFAFFSYDFSVLKNQECFNHKIKYYDNEITVAGIIFIVLNLLRNESIVNLVKTDVIFSLIATGTYSKGTGEEFIKRISHVDLEYLINDKKESSILASLVNVYSKYNDGDDENFRITLGMPSHPIYKISGSVVGNVIKVDKGSLTKTYYKDNYTLLVEDVSAFIELSNNLPPFALVDYLYTENVDKFDDKTSNQINKDLLYKLNKPKFYTDKNIYILQLPKTVSDFRVLSNLVSDAIVKISLEFESYLFTSLRINTKRGISTIGTALKELGISSALIRDFKSIRNFASHGYTLNDWLIDEEESRQFTLEFVVSTLNRLLNETFNIKNRAYSVLSKLITSCFVNVIVIFKYKQSIESAVTNMPLYPKHNKQESIWRWKYIENSCYDIRILECLLSEITSFIKIMEITVQGDDKFAFCLRDCPEHQKLFESFLSKNNLSIQKVDESKILTKYIVG